MEKSYLTIQRFSLPEDYNNFLVISGSLIHIQRFIYNTASHGALKNLRGRSFYMTLLARAVCEAILEELNLSHTSVLYNSGGTFCIIAATSHENANKLATLIPQIKQTISESHKADIININYANVSREDLESNCAIVFGKLFEKKHRDKFSPYGINADYDQLWLADNQFDDKSYEHIGAQLYNTSAILVTHQKIEKVNALCIDFSGLGVYFYMGKVEHLSTIKCDNSYILLINDEKSPENCSMPIKRGFIAGNGTRAGSFESLFDNEDSQHKHLAVIRLDVDNLGALFRTLMSKDDVLAEYSVMSQRLDHYFGEQINSLWNAKYSDSTVIIYSGGDDLFIVGEWETTLKFIQDIYTGFKGYFNSDQMSLSGGVVFIEPKYPIIRAAELSAIEEENAKRFEYAGKQKSAISMFGIPLRWEYEYQWVKQYIEELYTLVSSEELDESFIQHILRISENIEYQGRKITPIRYIWLAAYDLSRIAERHNNKIYGKSFIKRCMEDIMSGRTLNGQAIDSPYHSLQLITIAARLVKMRMWKSNN